jgi:predicted N-acyltransferase
VRTCSAHWIADRRYASAIADYLEQETPTVAAYMDELREHSPFKKQPA